MHRLDVNHLLFNPRKILGQEMMIRSRRKILQSTLALPVVLALPRASWSQADEYPNREIHSICMFPAGTGADIIVRYYIVGSEFVSRSIELDHSAGPLPVQAAGI